MQIKILSILEVKRLPVKIDNLTIYDGHGALTRLLETVPRIATSASCAESIEATSIPL
jgi:hypothetical protein